MDLLQAKAIILGVSAVAAVAAVGIAAATAASANGKVACKGLEGMTRQPEMAGTLLTNMLIAIGMVEAVPIIAAVIAIVLVFANPFISAL